MKTDLIYGVEDRPPFKDALFAALQHLLAIFVAIITPPLIIASALKLDVEKTSFLVSMSLFASGVSTFIQCRRFGPIGAKLLCIQGTSFSFIGPIIATGMVGGLPLIFGSCMAAAPIEMIVSRTFKYLRNIITPLVSGIVVLLIGLSLDMQKAPADCRIDRCTTLRGTSKRKNKISTTYKAAFLTPTQENRNAAFFMPSCYAVGAKKALIYAALRAWK